MKPSLNTSHKRFRAFQRSGIKPTVAPTSVDRSGGRKSHARRYWAWLRPQLKALLAVLALSIVGIGIDMVWPLVSAHLIDQVIL